MSPVPSDRYDEAIFANGIIKKVQGKNGRGGGNHPPPGRPRVKVKLTVVRPSSFVVVYMI